MKINLNVSEGGKWSGSWTIKLIVIGIMILLLLIPLNMVKNMIVERQITAEEVENQLNEQWGHEQTLIGPILNIPVQLKPTGENDKTNRRRTWLHLMPDDLNINGKIEPEIRYRGIYKNVVYKSFIKIKGTFGELNKNLSNVEVIEWDNAYITIGITDNRGIAGDTQFNWLNNDYQPIPGLITNDISGSGLSFKTPISENQVKDKNEFSIQLHLNGSESLYITPVGKKSDIQLQSSWKDPSFTGVYLPHIRNVTENGFNANWMITHLNRNYPQQWIGNGYRVIDQKLGVNLFIPVNHYQKSQRSLKYGILFITLTVLVFIFIELTKKKKIHLFQYLLVGLALVLFFSVLTALSEHIGFNFAYLIASITIVVMITTYSNAILKDKTYIFWISSLLVALYSFLFILLQLNDYAFLAGNIGLLVILGIIMRASLRIKQEN